MTHATSSVLITGGSFGLGLSLARELLRRNCRVAVCGRREDRLARARADLPALAAVKADIADANDRTRLLEEAARQIGEIDILVNNAAVSHAHDYRHDRTLGADRARDEIEINFAAPIELIRLFLLRRRQQNRDDRPASIVNISTPGALFPLEANPLYCASKAGFHIFTLALRRQLRDTPVKVLEVFPPSLDTGLATELDVQGQSANGQDVIDAVAKKTADGIFSGQETILPHKQAEELVRAIGGNVDAVADMANRGVRRRTDWATMG